MMMNIPASIPKTIPVATALPPSLGVAVGKLSGLVGDDMVLIDGATILC
jgi:hypothetical protein